MLWKTLWLLIPLNLTVQLYGINKYKPKLVKSIPAHDRAVYYLGWANKDTIISGSRDTKTKGYTLEQKNNLALDLNTKFDSPVFCLSAYKGKKEKIVYGTGDGNLFLLEKKAGKLTKTTLKKNNESIFCLGEHPYKNHVLAYGVGKDEEGSPKGSLYMHDTLSDRNTKISDHTDIVYELSWCKTKDNQHLLTTASLDGTVKVWHIHFDHPEKSTCIATTPLIKEEKNKIISAYDVEWHPTCNKIFAASYKNGLIIVFRIDEKNTLKEITRLNTHTRGVHSIKWHPSKKNILLSGSFDKTFKLWDIDHAACLYSSKKSSANIYFVCWNEYNLNRAAIGYGDGTIKIYDFFKKRIFPIKKFNDAQFIFKE